jgi:hypothetical protein
MGSMECYVCMYVCNGNQINHKLDKYKCKYQRGITLKFKNGKSTELKDIG